MNFLTRYSSTSIKPVRTWFTTTLLLSEDQLNIIIYVIEEKFETNEYRKETNGEGKLKKEKPYTG